MILKKVNFIWSSRDKDEFEWFHSLINSLEEQLPPNFLDIQVYLTEKLGLDEVHNITLRDKLEKDPITHLSKTRCNYGRPNWHQILKNIGNEVIGRKGKRTVGVFYCGPAPLADVLAKCTKASSSSDVEFVFRKEQF